MTNPINIKHVMMHGKIIFLLHVFHDLLQAGIRELFHFSAYLAHDMLMLLVIISPFELRDIIPELVLDNQFTFQQ